MMKFKKAALLAILSVRVLNVQAQQVAIENARNNYAYAALDCTLFIAANNLPCSSLFVKTNNGTIRREQGCEFIFTPKEVGPATIFVYKTSKNDTTLLQKRDYRIKSWPKQTAKLGGKVSGSIRSAIFKAQIGVSVDVENFDISTRIPITSFRFKILRNGDVITDVKNIGEHFNEIAQKAQSQIRAGDVVMISEIFSRMPGDKEDGKLNNITISIE